MRNVRWAVASIVIAALSLAALAGVGVLLRNGDLTELERKVLITTAFVGLEALALLCYLAAGKRGLALAALGTPMSLAAFGWAVQMLWQEPPADDLFRWFLCLVIGSATVAHICLLLGIAGRFRVAVALTTIVIMAVAGLSCYVIVEQIDDVNILRGLGIAGILDALGTVICLALAGARGRSEPQPPEEPNFSTPLPWDNEPRRLPWEDESARAPLPTMADEAAISLNVPEIPEPVLARALSAEPPHPTLLQRALAPTPLPEPEPISETVLSKGLQLRLLETSSRFGLTPEEIVTAALDGMDDLDLA